MIWYVIEDTMIQALQSDIKFSRGWGNGYVAISPSHCLHGVDYGDGVDQKLYVHGGITYSQFGDGVNAPKDWWVFGFTCMHWNDNLETWPKERVIKETMSLFWQLLELEWGEL